MSAFFQDMRQRDLGDPLLMVSDGTAGIIKAIETVPRDRRVSAASRPLEELVRQGAARAVTGAQSPSHCRLPRLLPRHCTRTRRGCVADYETELPTAKGVRFFVWRQEAAVTDICAVDVLASRSIWRPVEIGEVAEMYSTDY